MARVADKLGFFLDERVMRGRVGSVEDSVNDRLAYSRRSADGSVIATDSANSDVAAVAVLTAVRQ